MDKISSILMSFLLFIGLTSAAVTTVKRDNSQQLPSSISTSSDLETAESGKLLDLGGLLNRYPNNNNQGYSGYNPYGGGSSYSGGRVGYNGYGGGYYPNTGGYNSGFVPSTYYGGNTGYYGQQNPSYGYGTSGYGGYSGTGGYGGYGGTGGYGGAYGGTSGGYGGAYGGTSGGYGGYGTTNILGGGTGGYGGYGGTGGYGGYGGNTGNGGLKSYLGYDSDYLGHRNLGYGYYSDSDRYGFRNSYTPTSPALHVSGYRGYD